MKIRITAIALILCLLLTACGGRGTEGTDSTVDSIAESSEQVTESSDGNTEGSDGAEEVADYTLVNEGNALYGIVRAEGLSRKSADAVFALNGKVKELTGKYLKVTNDVDKLGDMPSISTCEILVGDTNRNESAEAKAVLEPYTFAVKFVNGKVVIVGDNDNLLCAAIEYFTANYLASDKVESGEGKLKLINTEDYVSVSKVTDFAGLISSAPALMSESKAAYTVPSPSSTIKTVQGGCLVGKYFYQAFLQKDTASDEQNNIVRIVKYDTEQKKVEKESADLPLNHANDITYNSKINALVVVHNNPNRTHISFVDPETLEITETKIIEYKIYCIDYNAKHDTYVIGLSGGQTFRIVDADFKAIGNVFQPTDQTKGYTTQGCACDDNYIYFVLYNKNVITVYNWRGEFVTLITLDVGAVEPENISIAGDTLYVGCASGGCKVFEVTVLLPEEAVIEN